MPRALIGAAVGGAAGGGYGYYVDTQEAKLRQLQGTGVQVQRNGDNLTLIMPGNITFASNSADISSSFYPTLNLAGAGLRSSTRTASTSSAIPTAPVRCS